MEKVSFKECGSILLRGFWMLGILLFRKHLLKTILVASLIANACLSITCMYARADRDYNDHKAYMMELKIDSLELMNGRK